MLSCGGGARASGVVFLYHQEWVRDSKVGVKCSTIIIVLVLPRHLKNYEMSEKSSHLVRHIGFLCYLCQRTLLIMAHWTSIFYDK